ncbi:MAG: hypothetical protein ACRD3F_10095 [Acidobacteriaceae bacterium]
MVESGRWNFLMSTTSLRDERTTKIVENDDLFLLRQHLQEIIEGAAFRGSHRSGQFLNHVVEQAIAGHFESLKERVIGIELFGRSPSYDTGDDAIVRVTASDVRKRLLQHYGRYGSTSGLRISLPLGSYVPEIAHEPPSNVKGNPEAHPSNEIPATAHEAQHPESGAASAELAATVVTAPSRVSQTGRSPARIWLIAIFLITALNLAIWGLFWEHANHRPNPPASILPWSVFFSSPHPIHVITSDPDIAEIQQYVGGEISTSDYANHNLIPNPDVMTPEVQHFWKIMMGDDKASFVDTKLAVRIAELANSYSKHIDVRAARNFQMSDLQTDDNFVLLGSPRSDPWSALFNDELDFRFIVDKTTGQEIIRNYHLRLHEAINYVPTALGGATGQSYAIVALVPNTDHAGQVLLIAGANAEGTEAAGQLLTDMPRLSAALHSCGISPTGPLQHFELLLKLNTMAGSPDKTSLDACHILSGDSTRP